ncbi:MAG: hypothetical protein NT075_31325 [Chloroflexi bacterium]|nr:hypothetical protein [Chloroflexota bacterium]
MSNQQALLAAYNNAMWCDVVCRAHGQLGEFTPELWLNRQATPAYYPNAVTLRGVDGCAAQMVQLGEFARTGVLKEWAVKDSFCTLDLTALGFRILFEAEWIYRAPDLPKPDFTGEDVQWRPLKHPSDLVAWEAAWAGEPVDEFSTREAIFKPSLLTDPDITFVAAYQAERIIAGAIANRTQGVVGLSNVFVPALHEAPFWAGCVAAVIDAFPGLPVVGYERDEELTQAKALGFETVGPLRIWVKVTEVSDVA